MSRRRSAAALDAAEEILLFLMIWLIKNKTIGESYSYGNISKRAHLHLKRSKRISNV
jgi:hypothetical protein